jgi:hypothetical protein
LVADDDAAGPDNGEFADGHAGADKDLSGEPGVGADLDGSRNERHGPPGEVVGAGAEVDALGEVGAAAEGDGPEVVEVDLATDHRAGFEPEFPRKKDAGGGEDDDLRRVGNVGSEETEETGAESVGARGAEAEESGLNDGPKALAQ